MLGNTEISALSSIFNVLFFFLSLFKNEAWIFEPLSMSECVLQPGIFFLSQKMWQQEEGYGRHCCVGTSEGSLWSVLYCARRSQITVNNHCQYEQILTLTLWGHLVKQWDITVHAYFLFSQMQNTETWQKIIFLGCQSKFIKVSYDMVVYHVLRTWFLRLETN